MNGSRASRSRSRKNKSYWQSGRPYLDGFVARVVEPKSALIQLEAGAIDLVRTEAVEDIVRLRNDPAYQAIQHPFAGTFYEFGINVTKPPYDNKLVRQAFNHAIDRQRYATSLMQGVVKPLALFWSSTSPGVRRGQERGRAVRPGQGALAAARSGRDARWRRICCTSRPRIRC